MLQQTQVARVLPRYREWLERWPTYQALAQASSADVIVAWSGLGYNRRAVSLHRCAQAVVERGGFPREPAELQRLPGIGPYTAAAVACFAFGADIAAPDTNANRVLERAFGTADVPVPKGRAYRGIRPCSTSVARSASPARRAANAARCKATALPAAARTRRCESDHASRDRFASGAAHFCARSPRPASYRSTWWTPRCLSRSKPTAWSRSVPTPPACLGESLVPGPIIGLPRAEGVEPGGAGAGGEFGHGGCGGGCQGDAEHAVAGGHDHARSTRVFAQVRKAVGSRRPQSPRDPRRPAGGSVGKSRT